MARKRRVARPSTPQETAARRAIFRLLLASAERGGLYLENAEQPDGIVVVTVTQWTTFLVTSLLLDPPAPGKTEFTLTDRGRGLLEALREGEL